MRWDPEPVRTTAETIPFLAAPLRVAQRWDEWPYRPPSSWPDPALLALAALSSGVATNAGWTNPVHDVPWYSTDEVYTVAGLPPLPEWWDIGWSLKRKDAIWATFGSPFREPMTAYEASRIRVATWGSGYQAPYDVPVWEEELDEY